MLEQLASASQFCPLPEGVDVVVQGAPAHAFYAVVDGSVIVHRDGQEAARLGSGDYFGERGLLDNAPRNATVTTAEPSTLLRLDGDVLRRAPDRPGDAVGPRPLQRSREIVGPRTADRARRRPRLERSMIRHESSGRAERARGFRTYVPRGIRIRSLKVAGGWHSVAR